MREPNSKEKPQQLDEQRTPLRLSKLADSPDGLTTMIEWERDEECDGRSVFRLIFNKAGQVLRHRVSYGGEG